METVPNFNSFISHLIGSKAQPLETHKGESNQCPGRASFKFGTGVSHSHAFRHLIDETWMNLETFFSQHVTAESNECKAGFHTRGSPFIGLLAPFK